MPGHGKFRFRKHDTIGSEEAESDAHFLENCFVETGDLQVLEDSENPRRIVVGRTGSGKTALLLRLQDTQERVINVAPESLALAYISNSTILQFFSDLGVRLNIFFRLLWRHVFSVEILKHHFRVNTESDKKSLLEKLRDLFRDQRHKRALEYLERWGKSFWEDTDYRVKEVTTTLEKNLKGALDGLPFPVPVSAEGSRRLSNQQKAEIVQRAQRVVNEVQIRELSEIINLIQDVLTDSQKRYYITIDKLDEEWIEDKLRYRLIRALIETVKDFQKVRYAKIVVAIRLDLLERVFRLTRDAGFQEEKYRSLYLHLDWSREQLIEVLNQRINYLVREAYTKRPVTYRGFLPKKVGREDTIGYVLDRTMMRPRDVIVFFNFCIQQACDRPNVTVQSLRHAEGEYSRHRLRSLADEWYADYPNLIEFARILRSRKKHFALKDITAGQCEDFLLDSVIDGYEKEDILSTTARQVVDTAKTTDDFVTSAIQVFYRVSLVGLKMAPYETFTWAASGRRSLSAAEITDETRVAVHPMFWRVLGIREN